MIRRVAAVLLVLSAAGFVFQALPNRSADAAPLPQGQGTPPQNLAIVVNQSNPVENLSLSDLRKIFLGERSHWPNGRRITLVMMEPGTPERNAMLRDIYQMNEKDFDTHFLHGLFTGEVFVSPKTLANSSGVRKFVFNVPGAIGYVRGGETDPSVKVLRIDGHLPEEKEYPLRLQARAGK
jgi:ABC-type phosphate transport system substrate-binding protein